MFFKIFFVLFFQTRVKFRLMFGKWWFVDDPNLDSQVGSGENIPYMNHVHCRFRDIPSVYIYM